MTKPSKSNPVSGELKGWQEIAAFLGQSVAVAQRWARSEGMPTERKGRYVFASREKLNQGLDVNPGNRSRFQRSRETLAGTSGKHCLSPGRRSEGIRGQRSLNLYRHVLACPLGAPQPRSSTARRECAAI